MIPARWIQRALIGMVVFVTGIIILSIVVLGAGAAQ